VVGRVQPTVLARLARSSMAASESTPAAAAAGGGGGDGELLGSGGLAL